MPDKHSFKNVAEFVAELARLQGQREALKAERAGENGGGRVARRSLSPADRAKVLAKTGHRCHICGGEIGSERWQADHVLAHSAGGRHEVDNYLPACATCNNYRWDYGSEEFQWILKLGVWLRTRIQTQTPLGKVAAAEFLKSESRRVARLRSTKGKVDFQDLFVGTGQPATRDHQALVSGPMCLHRGDLVRTLHKDWIDLKRREVIAGLRYGIEGMRVGGKRRIVIPPHLGYGEEGNPPAGIPPGALLICEVDLLELRPTRPSRRATKK